MDKKTDTTIQTTTIKIGERSSTVTAPVEIFIPYAVLENFRAERLDSVGPEGLPPKN